LTFGHDYTSNHYTTKALLSVVGIYEPSIISGGHKTKKEIKKFKEISFDIFFVEISNTIW
jgi:hypothetical protein